MRSIIVLLTSLFFAFQLQGQVVSFSNGNTRLADFEKRISLDDNSLVSKIPFKSIGPTIFSGRVTDIEVNPEDPSIFYVAYASGGLWKTENNGTTFTPIFDKEAVMTIGDIAVNWENEEIWVGTGEVNSSRSSYAGIGIYKSKNSGESWEHLGLVESHHIGKIIIHPRDPKTVWVAVLGHLYSPNDERGVYKTTDGGVSWKKVLYVDENSGAVDIVMEPGNPDILYAATWHRERRAWNFVEAGIGSGIQKSQDGGETWEKITTGFPEGEGVGRIGLAISTIGGKTKLFALLDNYNRRPADEKEKEESELTKDDLRSMSKKEFLDLDEKQLDEYLENNDFPEKYTASKVRKMVKKEEIEVKALAEYLENANQLLFDTPVIGAEVYASENGGDNWYRTHSGYLDGVYYSYGYYFGLIRVSPFDQNMIYIAGVPILVSEDGGKTFSSINQENVHADHHALWINPNRPGHLINGNDGGINISYDNGEHWIKCNSPAVGQFYYINVDDSDPYHVYGGTQDNGVWEGSHTYKGNFKWHSTGKYPYQSIMGGDGMQVQIDSRDNETIYTGFQFGNYFRVNKRTGKRQFITPRHDLGEKPYRWNWQAPIHLSIHNQDILYMGANKLFRSMNKGADFKAISEDLTNGGIKGDVPYGTLTTVHESKLRFGLIYTGSDDGLIHCTKDGGNNWEKISDQLPQNLWVSRVQASQHEEARVYASLNGYRWDDFNAYMYRSEDYGKNWKKIGVDLPMEPINVIKEDSEDSNILYVGTDHALYISMDGGEIFARFGHDMPYVAIHDLVVQKDAKHLLIGTHGRSIYKADISVLHKLNEIKDNALYVFDIPEISYYPDFGKISNAYTEPTIPEYKWPMYTREAGKAEISIETSEGKTLKKMEIELDKGINFIEYDLSIDPKKKDDLRKFLSIKKDETKDLKTADNGVIYLKPGTYQLLVKQSDEKQRSEFTIKERSRR